MKRNIVTTTQTEVLSAKSLGIINSLTQGYINVNSVYHLIKLEMPLKFRVDYYNSFKNVKIFVPHRSLSPYDQQASLHFRQALWALLLPVTIYQPISDIFRSYVMQVKINFHFNLFDKGLFIFDRD